MFALYDKTAAAFGRPIFEEHVANAVRALTQEVNTKDSKSSVAQWPEEFDLVLLGEFDNITGKYTPQEFNKVIVNAGHLKIKEEKKDENAN